MKISELSARAGVPASTLRFYETEGLLPAERAANGYRVYDDVAVDRLAFIAQSKQLDLPLPTVRELVTAWESEACQSVRAKYRPVLVEQAAAVAERIGLLDKLRLTLTRAIERLDGLPDRDDPCDANCAFLDRARPVLPVAPEQRTPIACSLDGDDHRARISDWHDLLADAPISVVEGGVRVTLPAGVLGRAAALAQAEQRCCTFYSFRIDLHHATFDMTITTTPEARTMLDDLLPTSPVTR